MKIYEPLGAGGRGAAGRGAARAKAYAEGLARYRARDFAGAAEHFARAADDPPAARFAERARELAQNPPGPDWEPVNTLEEK